MRMLYSHFSQTRMTCVVEHLRVGLDFVHKFCRIKTHIHAYIIIHLDLVRCLDARTACISIYSSDVCAFS